VNGNQAIEMTPEPKKSTHHCEVVVVHPEKHPNADKLAVVMVYGYSVCVGINDFKDGDLGVYIPPDSIVPTTEAFKWIWESKGYAPPPYTGQGEELNIPEKYRRIKAKILRGVVSEGLLIPLPGNIVTWVGHDVAELLGITHYEPPENDSLRTDCEKGPTLARRAKKQRGYPKTITGWYHLIKHWIFPSSAVYELREETGFDFHIPIYDIDAWQRYKGTLIPNETVWITEKIHGANCRFTWIPTDDDSSNGGRMYVGSHKQWKKDVPGSAFWEALKQNPWIESFCRQHPRLVLYGELVPTQTLKYGQEKGKYRVFAFDVLDPTQERGKWLDLSELENLHFKYNYWDGKELVLYGLLDKIHWVPTVAIVPYDEDSIRDFTGGSSLVPKANHLREGIVIRPIKERHSPYHLGRVILKIVSPSYLASKQSE
jgi:RNA ligase (TIGR02306 family)